MSSILIVGAGPTGMALALFLVKSGIKPRIIDKNTGPGQDSRAMTLQARTLEFYRQAGFADAVVNRGIKVRSLHVRDKERELLTFDVAEPGQNITPYPFSLSFPQDQHEQLLAAKLHELGIEVEWQTTLLKFTESATGIAADLSKNGANEQAIFDFLCGCDGAHSVVRRGLGFDFPGGTYNRLFYVTDVEATGAAAGSSSANICLANRRFVTAVFPIRSAGMYRLVGIAPPQSTSSFSFEDVRADIDKRVGISVQKVLWFSSYQVHHRVASHFRKGRAFILGDAGHIHSPAGGQGMNTGIGDAMNLAWKLAAVLQGRADPSLLATYEPERIAFARSLVSTTDVAFQIMAGQGPASLIFKFLLLPVLIPLALKFKLVARAAFRALSQIRIHYRRSALSVGRAGRIRGGDRLPWVPFPDGDNFESLKRWDWQIHIYGHPCKALISFAAARRIPLTPFPFVDTARSAGLAENALYLIRPDGYVAFASPTQDPAELQQFVEKFKISTR